MDLHSHGQTNRQGRRSRAWRWSSESLCWIRSHILTQWLIMAGGRRRRERVGTERLREQRIGRHAAPILFFLRLAAH